jgi:hypothetical protein
MERSKILGGAFGDAEDEEIVRRLRAKGHELHWVLETRLREFQRDGWKPVTKWDKTCALLARPA